MAAFYLLKGFLGERGLFAQVKTTMYLIFSLIILSVIIPFFAVICYPMWLVALLFSNLDPTLGRFVTSFDAWMDEDFTNNIPRSSIVTTIKLDGHLTLEELKTIFNTNVLQATLTKNRSKIRYPELQQYLTRFLGFRVWKRVDNFNIDDHITQRIYDAPVDISNIHQELANKPYHKRKSPWEVILINEVSSRGYGNSIIAARLHHCMADGKSILKLLVECLGQKPLKTAQAVKSTTSYLSNLKFMLLFPLHYYQIMTYIFYQFCTSHGHPLKMHTFRGDKCSRINVAFSPQLKLADLKQVAKRNGVTSSSVVMSLVAGAIRKCGINFGDRDVIMGYPLPKDDHPEGMANHVYMGIFALPTDQTCAIERLRKCNSVFQNAKIVHMGKYTDIIAQLSGSLIYSLSKRLAVNHFLPMFLTNIAGEEEGFSVKQLHCQDFRMSVGTLEGVASVIFCAFSYKDGMYIGINAKESVLSKSQTEELASDIALELKQLNNNNNNNNND